MDYSTPFLFGNAVKKQCEALLVSEAVQELLSRDLICIPNSFDKSKEEKPNQQESEPRPDPSSQQVIGKILKPSTRSTQFINSITLTNAPIDLRASQNPSDLRRFKEVKSAKGMLDHLCRIWKIAPPMGKPQQGTTINGNHNNKLESVECHKSETIPQTT